MLQIAVVEGKFGWKRWAGIAPEAVTTLAVVGALIFVPLLGWQNARLREQVRKQLIKDPSASVESEALRRTIEISAIEGTRLPESVIGRMQEAVQEAGTGQNHEFLVVAIMPTVCGVCLDAGLKSLQQLGLWQERGLVLHALVGEQSRSDREDALRLRQTGLLSFPITFVPAEELLSALFRHMEDEFTQEPLYLRLDNEFRILTAFQANQFRPALLDQWLEVNWPR